MDQPLRVFSIGTLNNIILSYIRPIPKVIGMGLWFYPPPRKSQIIMLMCLMKTRTILPNYDYRLKEERKN